MPKYYLVEDYTLEAPTGHPEKAWPSFKDGPSLMAWYRGECKKLESGMAYRPALIALRNYGRQNKAIEMNEDLWTKFLSVKMKNGESPWHFHALTPATTPWYSRSNDILLASLMEPSFFPSPKPPKPGKRLRVPRSWSRGTPLTVSGPAIALAGLLKWLSSKSDVVSEVGPKWSFLLEAVTSWEDQPAQYEKRVRREFAPESVGLVIMCTYHLLPAELRIPFMRQVTPLLSENPGNYTFLFQVFTDYNLWTEDDWAPRDPVEAKKYMYQPQSRGLRWADNNTNYNSLKRDREFVRLLNKLPAYAVTIFLEDALLYPSRRDNLPVWPELMRLPLDRREILLRGHASSVSDLWSICDAFFSEESDEDYRQASVKILNSLLPEHRDQWSTGASLGLSMVDMFFYLDSIRESHNMADMALPDNLVF